MMQNEDDSHLIHADKFLSTSSQPVTECNSSKLLIPTSKGTMEMNLHALQS